MKVPVLMPHMGQSIAEGTVVRWHKEIGDSVDADELLVEVESDKIAFEVGSPAAGKLVERIKEQGEAAAVGDPIGSLEGAGSAGQESVAVAATGEAGAKPTGPPDEEGPSGNLVVMPRAEDDDVGIEALPEMTQDWLSPSVARLAVQNDISMAELKGIAGSGRNGRVTRNDLLEHLANRPSQRGTFRPAEPDVDIGELHEHGEVVPMTTIRRTIADHMVQSIHTSAHVTMVHAVNASQLVALRKRIKDDFLKRHGVRITYTGVVLYVAARALREFPHINSSVVGTNILLRKEVNVGCAVALPDESLVVPVIRNADTRSFPEISAELERVIGLAREKKLERSDVEGGTFTISNFGSFGSLYGTPIINQPQVAILGIGAIQRTPVAEGDTCAVRDIMHLSFSFDHRVIDGAMGGRFLNALQSRIESITAEELNT